MVSTTGFWLLTTIGFLAGLGFFFAILYACYIAYGLTIAISMWVTASVLCFLPYAASRKKSC